MNFSDRRNAFTKHNTNPLTFIAAPKPLVIKPSQNDSSSSFDVRLDKEVIDSYEQELEILKQRKQEREKLEQKKAEKEAKRARKAAKKAAKEEKLKLARATKTDSTTPTSNSTYPRWEFGKTKRFIRPPVTQETNRAATIINKMMRGWWARIQCRIKMLEWKCDPNRAQYEIEQIRQEASKKMNHMRERMEVEMRLKHSEVTVEEKKCQDQKKIINYLKESNMKLREKNEKLYHKIRELKSENAQLEESRKIIDENMKMLQDHFEKEQKMNEKLNEVIPKYQQSVEKLEEANAHHGEYGEVEHLTKLLYAKTIGQIMQRMESDCKDKRLIDELLDACLELNDEENPLLLEPIKEEVVVDDDDESSVSSSDDSSVSSSTSSASEYNDRALASLE